MTLCNAAPALPLLLIFLCLIIPTGIKHTGHPGLSTTLSEPISILFLVLSYFSLGEMGVCVWILAVTRSSACRVLGLSLSVSSSGLYPSLHFPFLGLFTYPEREIRVGQVVLNAMALQVG